MEESKRVRRFPRGLKPRVLLPLEVPTLDKRTQETHGRRIDRGGILSASRAERGGGPHFANCVRNDLANFLRKVADLKFGRYIRPKHGQDGLCFCGEM